MELNNKALWLSLAGLWGFAEATAFFIVPDVLLTAAALFFGVAAAIRFAAFSAAMAVVGGLIMWRWGAIDAEAARDFLLSVPLIDGDLTARVQDEIAGAWPVNLGLGAITGAPYKIYAVEAGAAATNPYYFAIVSFIARFSRFAIAIVLVAMGAKMFSRITGLRAGFGFIGGVWGTIYLIYVLMRLNA